MASITHFNLGKERLSYFLKVTQPGNGIAGLTNPENSWLLTAALDSLSWVKS